MLGELAAREAGKTILSHIKHSPLLKHQQLGEVPQEEVRPAAAALRPTLALSSTAFVVQRSR